MLAFIFCIFFLPFFFLLATVTSATFSVLKELARTILILRQQQINNTFIENENPIMLLHN